VKTFWRPLFDCPPQTPGLDPPLNAKVPFFERIGSIAVFRIRGRLHWLSSAIPSRVWHIIISKATMRSWFLQALKGFRTTFKIIWIAVIAPAVPTASLQIWQRRHYIFIQQPNAKLRVVKNSYVFCSWPKETFYRRGLVSVQWPALFIFINNYQNVSTVKLLGLILHSLIF